MYIYTIPIPKQNDYKCEAPEATQDHYITNYFTNVIIYQKGELSLSTK